MTILFFWKLLLGSLFPYLSILTNVQLSSGKNDPCEFLIHAQGPQSKYTILHF